MQEHVIWMTVPVQHRPLPCRDDDHALPAGMWRTDARLRLTCPPGGAPEWRGLPLAELASALAADPLLQVGVAEMRERFIAAVDACIPLQGILIDCPFPEGGSNTLELSADPLTDAQGQFRGYLGLARELGARRERENAILAELQDYTLAFEAANDGLWEWNAGDRMIHYSPGVSELLGGRREARSQTDQAFLDQIHPEDLPRYIERTAQVLGGALDSYRIEYRMRDLRGEWIWVDERGKAIRDENGRVIRLCGASSNVSDRKKAEEERLFVERQLRHAQKLESLGTLAGGVAHEINTPAQYVRDNIHFLGESLREMAGLLERYGDLTEVAREGRVDPERLAHLKSAVAKADLPFLLEEVPRALLEAREGVARVAEIVRAIKEFSHPGGKDKVMADLNRAIATTATVTRNQWKAVAELQMDLDERLPPVPCYLGEFNQVVLNLIVNAADALAQTPGERPGRIQIATRQHGEWAEMRVADNGPGIAPEIADRIFDPFFTTKPVGQGSGQGLALCHAVVTKKHGGRLRVETTPEGGAAFVVWLPLDATQTMA